MNTARLTRAAARTSLKLRKHSPHILFGAGIAGSVATVVVACKATLKAQEVREAHKAEIEKANDHLENNRYSTDAHKQHIVQTWTKTSIEYAKLYGPAFILGVTSLAFLTKSHQILTTRNTAITAAYMGVDSAFKAYRQRVVEELGEQKDTEFAHGSVENVVTGYDEKGNGVAKTVKSPPKDASSIYGQWFMEDNRNWSKHPGYNHEFLDNQQKWANIELKRKGHIFLNEVYDLLGMERTKEGQIVGWVWNRKDGEGDGYVDFGFNRYPEFVAGYERSVFLDFNVDGPILEMI